MFDKINLISFLTLLVSTYSPIKPGCILPNTDSFIEDTYKYNLYRCLNLDFTYNKCKQVANKSSQRLINENEKVKTKCFE